MKNTVDAVAPALDETTIALGFQVAVSGAFVLLMVTIHGLGLLGISRLLKLNADQLKKRDLDFAAVLLVGTTGVLLFILHIMEIVVFAIFYIVVDRKVSDFADALYYSAAAYATLGTTRGFIPTDWQLVGALEALIGFVLIGWSTAFVARTMSRLEA